MRKTVFSILVFGIVSLALVLNACAPQKNLLEQVKDSGELRVLTRNAATTYYIGPHGPTGPEYDLIKAFAQHLGVSVNLEVEDNLQVILDKITNGDAHIAAAGLTVTDERQKFVRFTTPYQNITQQLVYRQGNGKPRSVAALTDGFLEVLANSSHAERLLELQQEYPELKWMETEDMSSSELITLVVEEVLDYTVADSNDVALMRRYHPEVRVAFDISKQQELAWAMPKTDDDSLYQAAVEFLESIKENGELDTMLARHYGHIRNYDYAGTPTYMRHIAGRLPTYMDHFKAAAKANNLDWRLVAAVAYQESHWNPLAVSPTGVKGIMMLTKVTAAELGVIERTDPVESIDGGARYLRTLFDKFAGLPEPDRTWLTLAAYNVGYGHVKDAQWLTENSGGDPTHWTDVKQKLPLLSQQKWYRQTKYGYARGHEPVKYVENIRSYYDILRWHVDREKPHNEPKPIMAFSSPVL
ncbi:MAG: membrane-bound lytic murein transglycosylase MltF [Gammaproteobacteria bacterium]|nr:membrane-bound lytic murein transglycosylase MltF [Gammaproteobacteria bacterium]